MIFNPQEDGTTHLNIYSKGETELGRFLSNFTYFPLEIEDGNFRSVEGYWYWLRCDSHNWRKDELRYLTGFDAKKAGKEILKLNAVLNINSGNEDVCSDDFKTKIKQAIRYKIENSSFLKEFINSTLPFAHYYVVFGRSKDAGYKWLVEYHEELRKELKNKV